MTPKYHAKADANQPEMVGYIRSLPKKDVIHTHMVGGGAPDIIVGDGNGFMVVGPDAHFILDDILFQLKHNEPELGVKVYKGANLLVEIKDGSKPPSKQKLTDDEAKFHDSWPGQIGIWNSVESVLSGLGLDT